MRASLSQLSEVCDFIKDGTHGSPERSRIGVPVLSAEHVNDGRLSFSTGRFTTEKELADFRKRLHPMPGDVLLTIVGTIGRAAVLRDTRPFIFQRSVCVFRPRQSILHSEYLRFVFESEAVRTQLVRETKQVAQAGVYLESLNDIEVPLPSLPQQRQIAQRLEQADRLRHTYRYALQLTDSFLPAAFLKLFGDPVTNPMNWQRAKVCELGDVETGNTPPREITDYYGDAIEWIKSDNISLDYIIPAKASEGLSESGITIARIVEANSLLITCIAGSENSIGNVVLTDRRVAFNQQINAVTPHPDIDPWFLYGLFRAAKPLIQRSTTLAMKRMITKGKLEELLLIRPPLPLQQKFAALVHRTERLRAAQREALRQADHLFASLLHQAFQAS